MSTRSLRAALTAVFAASALLAAGLAPAGAGAATDGARNGDYQAGGGGRR